MSHFNEFDGHEISARASLDQMLAHASEGADPALLKQINESSSEEIRKMALDAINDQFPIDSHLTGAAKLAAQIISYGNHMVQSGQWNDRLMLALIRDLCADVIETFVDRGLGQPIVDTQP